MNSVKSFANGDERKMVVLSVLAISVLIFAQVIDFGGLIVLPILVGNYLLAAYGFFRVLSKLSQRKVTAAAVYALSCVLVTYLSGIPFIQAGKYEVVAAYFYLVKNGDAVNRSIEASRRSSPLISPTAEFSLGGGYATPAILVYDESQQLLLPYDRRSQTWHEMHSNSEFKCAHAVQQVKANFFLVNFAC